MHVCSCLNAASEEPSISSPDCRIGDILLPSKPSPAFVVSLYSQLIVHSITLSKRVPCFILKRHSKRQGNFLYLGQLWVVGDLVKNLTGTISGNEGTALSTLRANCVDFGRFARLPS